MFLYTLTVSIVLMMQFVFASWDVCVTDQANVWFSEGESKSLQWLLYGSIVGGPQ